jgi:hypothetical protein
MIRISETTCPLCGRTIQFQPKAGEPARLTAQCDCGSGSYRHVIEIDDPNYISLEDRLEPGEPAPSKNWKRSKKS